MNRWVAIGVAALLALVTLIFVFQNLHVVRFSFLGLSLELPLAILAAIFYVLGLVTGGSLISLVRWTVRGVQQPRV